LKDELKAGLFLKDFSQKVRYDIYKAIRELRSDEKIKDVSRITWDNNKNRAAIIVDDVWNDAEINALNTNTKVALEVKKYLKEIYRYEGDFYFENDIPF
jgi:hypothetical protein